MTLLTDKNKSYAFFRVNKKVKAQLDQRQNLNLIIKSLDRSTVQITTLTHRGSGFFVSKDTILTCASILNGAPKEVIKIIKHKKEYEVISYSINLDIDVAVIKISTNEGWDTSCVYLDVGYQSEDHFCIYGYSSTDDKKVSSIVKYQSYSSLHQLVFFIGKSIKGHIGAPLLNQRTQKVCGIVRSQRTVVSNNGIRFTGGDAIPIATIFKKIPEIKKLNYDFHQINSAVCNLPLKDYNKFIGRELLVKQLLEYISPTYRQHVIVLNGIGGSGKTAIAIEAAYRCWEARKNYSDDPKIPIFDAIIFTSFRNSNHFPDRSKSLKTSLPQVGLSSVVDPIIDTLYKSDPPKIYEEQQLVRFSYQLLNKQSTLLIIDGIDDISSEKSHQILDFLNNLPSSTKAIVTTRDRSLLHSHIFLASLSEQECYQLVESQAQTKKIVINSVQIQQIYKYSRGLPIAIIYALGQYITNYENNIFQTISYLEQDLDLEDLGSYYFEQILVLLREQPAYNLLMSIAIFRDPPCLDALVYVAGLEYDSIMVSDALLILQKLSLITEDFVEEERRYRILGITCEYALTELANISEEKPLFEENLRQRWVEWYRSFTGKYSDCNSGENDHASWEIKKELENIGGVLSWCAAQQRYDWIREIWHNVDPYIEDNKYWLIRSYWWEYLKQASQGHSDIETYIKALSEKSSTLIMMGEKYYLEAEKCLLEAWKFYKHTDKLIQANLANNFSNLARFKQDYQKEQEWINTKEEVLRTIPANNSMDTQNQQLSIELGRPYDSLIQQAF